MYPFRGYIVKRAWRATNYEFDLRRVSFVLSEDFSYRVSLFNDQVRRVVGNDTGKIYDQATNSHLFRTVEDYFDIIKAAEKDQVYSLNVHYDPVFGFPNNISIGRHPMIQDGGVSYMITNYMLLMGCDNYLSENIGIVDSAQ